MMQLFRRTSIQMFFLFLIIGLVGCGNMNATISSNIPQLNEQPSIIPEILKPRTSPDAVYAEYIKTMSGTPGYEIRATVGEISEVKTSLNGNGYVIEGVFYE